MSANPSMMNPSESVVTSQQATTTQALGHKTSSSSLEYRVVYALVFAVCLAITGLCRLLPRNRHPWICSGDDGSRSLWSEARGAADSTVPYVFQQ